jgi:hypothetical protein
MPAPARPGSRDPARASGVHTWGHRHRATGTALFPGLIPSSRAQAAAAGRAQSARDASRLRGHAARRAAETTKRIPSSRANRSRTYPPIVSSSRRAWAWRSLPPPPLLRRRHRQPALPRRPAPSSFVLPSHHSFHLARGSRARPSRPIDSRIRARSYSCKGIPARPEARNHFPAPQFPGSSAPIPRRYVAHVPLHVGTGEPSCVCRLLSSTSPFYRRPTGATGDPCSPRFVCF